MSHVDPFAPADSDQHPSRWRPARKDPHATRELAEDSMPRWIRLDDQPVAQDNPDASIIGQQRWEEYRSLLELYGTGEQKTRMDARSPFDEEQDAGMPTLAALKAQHLDAQSEPPEPADQTGPLVGVEELNEPKTPEDELAAKLKALEAEGL